MPSSVTSASGRRNTSPGARLSRRDSPRGLPRSHPFRGRDARAHPTRANDDRTASRPPGVRSRRLHPPPLPSSPPPPGAPLTLSPRAPTRPPRAQVGVGPPRGEEKARGAPRVAPRVRPPRRPPRVRPRRPARVRQVRGAPPRRARVGEGRARVAPPRADAVGGAQARRRPRGGVPIQARRFRSLPLQSREVLAPGARRGPLDRDGRRARNRAAGIERDERAVERRRARRRRE